ncbi:hypothetical protein GCM10023149_38480 [Mucilaginibacter gynuensis]|uniref:Uncharacterized protein n=2 Tax=Mucilaginibacter gynuensis TaxID=1302236 RepID=A0ABP8GZK5_9SPHI
MEVYEDATSYSYKGFSKKIALLSQLPPKVNKNVDRIMRSTFGDFYPYITFRDGQIVNLKKYFADSNALNRKYGIIPKYDLVFRLKDTLSAIKLYTIFLQLDEYGQVLHINWPRAHPATNKFRDVKSVEYFVLKKAVEFKFNEKGYTVHFSYDKGQEKFFWEFMFPVIGGEKGERKDYDVIKVNWQRNDENNYMIYKTQVISIYD